MREELFLVIVFLICILSCVALLYVPPIYAWVISIEPPATRFEEPVSGYFSFLTNEAIIEEILNSFASSLAAAGVATFLSFSILYVTSRASSERRLLPVTILCSPFFLGTLFTGYILPSALHQIGFPTGWYLGVLALTAYCVPLCSVIIFLALDSKVRSAVSIARVCGASERQAFLRVTLPLIWSALLACILFSFLFSLNNTDAAMFALRTEPTIQSKLWGSLKGGLDVETYRLNATLFWAFLSLAVAGGLIAIVGRARARG